MGKQMAIKLGEKWKIKDVTEKLFRPDKKGSLIFAAGMIGIVLIFLSGMFGLDNKSGTADPINSFQTEEYIEKLEKKVHTMVTGIDGVGTAKVMITLENTTEYIYESEKKETNDMTKDYADGQTQKEQERIDYERSVILVDGADGREALLRTTVEPKVKGVVVVCQGGENVAVEKRVIDAVTTALDISSNRVCVAKLAE